MQADEDLVGERGVTLAKPLAAIFGDRSIPLFRAVRLACQRIDAFPDRTPVPSEWAQLEELADLWQVLTDLSEGEAAHHERELLERAAAFANLMSSAQWATAPTMLGALELAAHAAAAGSADATNAEEVFEAWEGVHELLMSLDTGVNHAYRHASTIAASRARRAAKQARLEVDFPSPPPRTEAPISPTEMLAQRVDVLAADVATLFADIIKLTQTMTPPAGAAPQDRSEQPKPIPPTAGANESSSIKNEKDDSNALDNSGDGKGDLVERAPAQNPPTSTELTETQIPPTAGAAPRSRSEQPEPNQPTAGAKKSSSIKNEMDDLNALDNSENGKGDSAAIPLTPRRPPRAPDENRTAATKPAVIELRSPKRPRSVLDSADPPNSHHAQFTRPAAPSRSTASSAVLR